MEAPVFTLFCLAIGYLMYWAVMNDKHDPNSGQKGWFALKSPRPKLETEKQTWNGQSQDARSGS